LVEIQDIIKWLNDRTNRKIISWILILSGAASLLGGASGLAIDQSFGTGLFSEDAQMQTIIASFLITVVFSGVFGIMFLILGIRLLRSAE
jgi:hypothetical protein